jgi:hypothetical protein
MDEIEACTVLAARAVKPEELLRYAFSNRFAPNARWRLRFTRA